MPDSVAGGRKEPVPGGDLTDANAVSLALALSISLAANANRRERAWLDNALGDPPLPPPSERVRLRGITTFHLQRGSICEFSAALGALITALRC